MENIKLYEIDPAYINYLGKFAPHLFHNKAAGQVNERKYIGVVLTVNGMDYFAPLSSFKEKHQRMSESVDFLKIKNYNVDSTSLARRCNDFIKLEEACKNYKVK